VLRIWEHDLKRKNEARLLRRLEKSVPVRRGIRHAFRKSLAG
jgi:hypothetical protein